MSTGDMEKHVDSGTDADALRAELLRRRLAGHRSAAGRRTGIPRADRDVPLPLSHGQQQMWFLSRLEPDSPEYLVPLVLRLRGALDPEALERAWQGVLERHEILRTRYVLDGDEPVQVVDAPVPLPLEHSAAAGDDAVRTLVEADLARTFDLGRDWPVRGRLIRIAPGEHVLAVMFHHIACDAWSAELFGQELGELYSGATPAPLDLQYADFAAWQRSTMTNDVIARHLGHWTERLAGLAPLDLPADRSRPAVRDGAGDAVPFDVPEALANRLRDLAAAHDSTLFMLFLAAFQTLLARYTGRSDIAVGTVVSGRGRPELQRVIGYGINSLVLRGDLSGDPAFTELLARTRTTVLDAYDHQDVAFAQVVEALAPERDLSRTPLFQVAFTMHGDRSATFDLPGIEVSPFEGSGRFAKFDLDLQLREGADGSLGGHLEYATALFDRTTVERLRGHLLRLLTSIVADPGTPLSALEIIGETERALLTGPPRQPRPVTHRVHELFEAQVARTPDRVAVSYADTDLTYAELNARANRIAHALIARGAGPETLVGLSLERGTDLIPALLGILKSGAAYLPLDPANPADRIAYIVRDAQAPVVVTTRAHAELFDSDLLLLDADAELIAGKPDTDPAVAGSPENLIYTIYTSGSTGRPKGVALTHGNVVRLMDRGREHFAFDAADVWTLFHSYAFDFSVWEMWGALLYGGRLIVVPDSVARSPEEFLGLLVRERVTFLNQTPTAFRALVGTDTDLALRAVVFGGEKLEVSELRPWADRFGLDRTALVNMYGITETTVHTTYRRLTERDLDPQAGNPVGHPLDDLRVVLLDQDGRLVPLGVPGEICVGGAGVARGYLNQPRQTAERFVPDPFGPPGSRLYRSGDLARRLADGSLEFLGRIDDQVKIRGFRIELGEIEAALAAHPRVRDAVVLVREDTPGDKRLVAYVTPAGEDIPDPGELRSRLTGQLPEYMVPAAFVALDALPLTTNGKLDKRALPAPGQDALGAVDFVAPRTVAEERIAAVWADVLGLERVGVEDGFFDLGGHSIRAVTLVGRLRAIGYDLAVRDVFEYRTVARIAELVTGRPAPADADRTVAPFASITAEDVARVPEGVVDAYPLSQVQLGMAVEMLTDDGRRPYHNATSFRIRDDRPFSAEALRAAAAVITARHDVLRTSFALTGYSVPMQLVHATAELPVAVHDVSHLSKDELLADLGEFVRQERAEPFDLAVPPVLRLSAHVAGDASWWLTVTEFHAILDGWSHHSLLMEMLEEYGRIRDGREAAGSPRPAVRFADFVAAELDALASEESRAYWQSVVDGHARLTVPAPWRGDPDDTGAPHRVPVPFHDLEDRLRALASKAGASFKSVLHAAHLKTLSMLTEEERFFTGLVCNARPEVLGADRVYGMHLNTLPFAYDRSAGTWRELVAAVFAREVELWPHRAYPMPVIQRELADGERLVDIRFSYHDFDQVDHDQVDYLASIDDSPTEFSLGVSARIGHLVLTAAPRTLSRSGTDRLAHMLRRVLEAMAADPEGDARTSFLPEGEPHRQLVEWNDTADEQGSASVLQRFEEQAARTPDAVAVEHSGATVSYAELDARANRLAHHLRGLGVTAESRVLVRLDRGPDLLTALLAVWKAGGAYVPIDPSYPVARVAAMREAAAAVLTLTELPDAEALAALPATAPVRPDDPDGLAYVVFTSGSTGVPKGVEVPHRGLANHVAWAARELASRGTGGAPLFSSVAFDLVVPNLWAPLVVGQTVHMVGQDVDLADLGQHLAAAGPYSFVKLTPGHLDVLARQLTAEQAAALAPVLVVAGEAFTRATLERWRALEPDAVLINEYGPTEASVGSTVFPVPTDTDAEVLPIGRPLPNMRTYVLDAALEPVPVGVAGELYVGGTGVARGYAGRPDLTAERFLPDPYGVDAGARMYRTGDLVRQLPDGNIEFLGRIDDQVKIRGYRVELGEIQTLLTEHPAVREAFVTTHEGELTGYYAPAEASANTVRAHLADRLPDYMVPAALVALEALPLNANGKVDRRALPVPEAGEETADGYIAPRTVTEERIAEVWAQVLGLERVGVEDGFFEIGGHSIRAVALVGALRSAGYDVGVRDVFEHRTVAELSEFLTGRPARTEVDTPVERFALIAAEDRERLPEDAVDAYPLTQVQLGMVLEMLADDTKHAYHNVSSFRITEPEPFSAEALHAAARVIAARHEMLRTSLHLEGYSGPLQVVHAEAAIPVTVQDLRGLDEAGRRGAVEEFLVRERADLFDLEQAPLLRMTAHIEDAGWRLGVTVCHAVTEGWSHRALLMELLDAYRSLRVGGEPPSPPTSPVRYADFVAAELRSLESERDRAYWTGITGGYARFRLPAAWAGDRTAGRERYRSAVELREFEPGLRALAARARVSVKSVLLAAHLKVLSLLTEERHFHSGLVFSARPEAPGADRVYGMYLNTLPFAFDADRDRTWEDLVREVFAHEAGMWEHRRYPMPAIQRDAGAERLLDVRFSYQDFDHVDTERVDVGGSSAEGATEFDLAVSAVSGYLLLTTHTHALSRANTDRLTALYAAVLSAMAQDPAGDARIAPLPAEERERQLAEWNDTACEQGSASVLQRFEEQAARVPGAPAVTLGAETLTYAELDARANRLAHALRARGVGAETRVAVQLDRGPALIATLLAVWKAGGAYVPVDPAYPAERVASLVETSGARLAVTAEAYADRFRGVTVLLADEDVSALPATAPVRPDDPDGLAYVVFTSGSTGVPKGVEVPHRGLANHVAWAARELASRGTGGAPLFSSVAFDLVVPNLWGPLVTGQRVFTVAQDAAPAELGRALLAGAPYSFVKLTPGHLELLAAQLTTEQADELSAVTVVAGEALPGTTADRSLGILGPGRLVNEYGPTEASVGSTVFPVREPVGREVVPIGRPLPNMRTYVLDAALEPVPVGVAGELYVGGTGVARGYAGRPDLTAERFLPDPYGVDAGARMYRTGDLVRQLPDGNIEFLGRIDDQVKIRGYRVELGEIQTVLTEHPAVREAFVSVHEPVPGDRRLVAYWTATTGSAEPAAEELAGHCAVRLPDYMVPAAFVALEALPLNPNGKVDRRALPVPDRGALRTGTDHVPPRTPTEKALAAIWSGVLGVDQIGVHDRFFDLGGHSLLMIKVLAAARAAGLAVSIYRMYQHDTLIELAAAVDADARAQDAPGSNLTAAGQGVPGGGHGGSAGTRVGSGGEFPGGSGADGRSATVEVPAELLTRLLQQAAAGDPAALATGAPAEAAALIAAVTSAQGGTTAGPDGPSAHEAGIDAVMADHRVPGVALAVLRDGAVAAVEGHGVLAAGGSEPVTARTLFQVGSVSKHVTALAVLRLVDQGLLDLDSDIETYLTSWHLADAPEAPGPVTPRMLLGHRAGLARQRSVGFRPGEPVPGLLDLLTGRPPAVTSPVRRELPPDATFRKSSTHYWVLQQVLEDVTGEEFESLMRRLVLDPLGLADTSFDQDHPRTSGLPVALGHDAHGAPLKGGWRTRAHLAAAGLWTTAADTARFVVAVRDALLGAPGALVPQALARELLAGETGTFYGLGTIVDDSGDDLEFGHGGEPSGYWNMAISRLHSGTGFVALTNADSGKAVVKHLTAELGRGDAAFGSGRLASEWRSAGSSAELPVVLAPVVTDEERA